MVRQHRSVEINDDVNASVNAGKVSARARRLLAGAAGACLLAGASLTLAPSATAGVIPSCADQSFGPNSFEDYCSVEDGETVYFIVRSAGGGKGGDSYDGQLGGFGGLGYQVTGSYTNSTGGAVTLNVTVGFPGVDGLDGTGPGDPDGQDGAPGNLAALSVDGGSTLVLLGAGTGGVGGVGSSGRAASGTDASRVIPVSLDAGWTGGTTTESPIVSFSSTPPPSPDGGSSGGAPAVTQQFGAPGVGTCDEQADPALDWAGVSAGGWGRSWAWWMNEGLGGDVCNRTLVSGPNGQWMVS